jgi:FkbM family methyltransferase
MTHHPVFERFERWRGTVDAGWTVNFLGVRTRDEFNAGWPGFVPSESRHVETGYPAFDEEYFEWVDVLEAVVGADGPFTMIELGAGWGRWLMIGAAAARRQNRRPCRLVAVEAEPTHYRYMRRHFADNDVQPEALTLIEAAVAAQEGRVKFHVGDPSAWYGQAIEHSQAANRRLPAVVERLRARRTLRRSPDERGIVEVRAVTLASILRPLDRVDLIDLDVQGVEAEVLEAAEDAIARKVLRVHVGTHSEDNETRLRTLFGRLGWTNLNDYAAGAQIETPWGPISFQDGVQTWRNPALTPA